MGRTREEMVEEAEAETRRANDALTEKERALAEAKARLDEIESESGDTEDETAEISSRVEAAEQEIERLQEEVSDAEEEYRSALESWEHYMGLGDDDDDTGEALSAEDAADIWRSKGMDSDYTFGYSEDELRRASGTD